MSDKTCGTCGRGYPAVICSAKYPVGAVMCHDESCDKWTERIDSVEQVALEMWRDLGRSIKYADRLRALGVEVEG